jgi:hypothetical protein
MRRQRATVALGRLGLGRSGRGARLWCGYFGAGGRRVEPSLLFSEGLLEVFDAPLNLVVVELFGAPAKPLCDEERRSATAAVRSPSAPRAG